MYRLTIKQGKQEIMEQVFKDEHRRQAVDSFLQHVKDYLHVEQKVHIWLLGGAGNIVVEFKIN